MARKAQAWSQMGSCVQIPIPRCTKLLIFLRLSFLICQTGMIIHLCCECEIIKYGKAHLRRGIVPSWSSGGTVLVYASCPAIFIHNDLH